MKIRAATSFPRTFPVTPGFPHSVIRLRGLSADKSYARETQNPRQQRSGS